MAMVFTNTREGSVQDLYKKVAYIDSSPDSKDTGFVIIKLEPSGTRVSLCTNTKLILNYQKDGRVFFAIADGNNSYEKGWLKGLQASLSVESASKFLKDEGPESEGLVMTLDLKELKEVFSKYKNNTFKQFIGSLEIPKFFSADIEVTLNTNSYNMPVIPVGTYNVWAPTGAASIPTDGYRVPNSNKVRGDRAWFPIEEGGGLSSERFIHLGHVSHGCVSVMNPSQWTDVYETLINNRLPGPNGRQYVGQLKVTNNRFGNEW